MPGICIVGPARVSKLRVFVFSVFVLVHDSNLSFDVAKVWRVVALAIQGLVTQHELSRNG